MSSIFSRFSPSGFGSAFSKLATLSAILFFGSHLALAETTLPDYAKDQLKVLEEARLKEHAAAMVPINELNQLYMDALVKKKESSQKAGDIKPVLAAGKEIERLKANGPPAGKPSDPEIAQLWTTYTETLKARQAEVKKLQDEADKKHDVGVDLVVKDLTKDGLIDEAVLALARKVAPQVAKSDPPAPAPTPKPTPAPPTKGTDKANHLIGTSWTTPKAERRNTYTYLEDGVVKLKDWRGRWKQGTYKITDTQVEVIWPWSKEPEIYTFINNKTEMRAKNGVVWESVKAAAATE